MKSFELPAAAIVRRLAEDADDEDFGDDIKDVIEIGQENHWMQIDGDANPWVWGGTWYNPAENSLLHFDGIDQDGVKEIDSDKVPIPPAVLAKVNARIHDPYLDTPEAKEDPAWLKRMLDHEERERDYILGHYQVARAEFLNNRLQHKFWLIHVCKPDDWILRQYSDKVKSQFDPDMQQRYDEWPVQNKLVEIGRYIGFDQIGHDLTMSYIEAKKFLGDNRL